MSGVTRLSKQPFETDKSVATRMQNLELLQKTHLLLEFHSLVQRKVIAFLLLKTSIAIGGLSSQGLLLGFCDRIRREYIRWPVVSILQHRRHIFSLSFRQGAYSYYIYQCIPLQPRFDHSSTSPPWFETRDGCKSKSVPGIPPPGHPK